MKTILLLFLTSNWLSAQIPRNCSQAVIGTTSSWNSSHVTLSLYQKKGRTWQRVGSPWKGRLGKNGLAWGHGIHPQPRSATRPKSEGDGRAPAGIFELGGAYGYDVASLLKLAIPFIAGYGAYSAVLVGIGALWVF